MVGRRGGREGRVDEWWEGGKEGRGGWMSGGKEGRVDEWWEGGKEGRGGWMSGGKEGRKGGEGG